MQQKQKTRRLGHRASECVAWTADSSEHTTPLALQATRLLRRFGMSPALALTVAEIAFDHRRPAP